MTLRALIEEGWRDHGDQPEDVAVRLAGALPLLGQPDDYPPFVRLLTHVYGEHLGEWQRGVGLLEASTRLPSFAPATAASAAVRRGVAALRLGGGDRSAVLGLSDADRAHAFASAADALAARGDLPTAIDYLGQALACASAPIPRDHPAIRALAARAQGDDAAFEAGRRTALAHYALVPEDDRRWCARERDEIGA